MVQNTMYELGVLEDEGGLKNFTTLAETVIRVDTSLRHVEDAKASKHVRRMLDHVFSQAYRGQKPMLFLAQRLEQVLELLGVPAVAQDPWRHGARPDDHVPGWEHGGSESTTWSVDENASSAGGAYEGWLTGSAT